MKSSVSVCALAALLLACACRASLPPTPDATELPTLASKATPPIRSPAASSPANLSSAVTETLPVRSPVASSPPADPSPTLTDSQEQTASAAPTPACAETTGRLEARQIDSPNLPRPLRVEVYLPPCYDLARTRPYPLLVMLHGQGSTQAQWVDLGLTATAGRLAARGEIPPFIIALPYEDDHLKNPFETGYEAALAEDLLPWLSREYHACPERACRAVGGLSRGAAYAARMALSRWQLFAAAGAHSLAPFYGDPARTPAWVEAIPPGQMPALWLDSGERDRYRTEALAYSDLLNRLGVSHTWQTWPGEHDEAYWSAHVEDYLRWYGQAVGLDY